MRKNGIKMGQLFILSLVFMSAFIAAVSAGEDRGSIKSDATEAQLELINELLGKDVTVLEYMEKVHPEHLVGVSDSMKENMAKQKMNWWGKEPSTSQTPLSEESKADRGTVSVTATG